MKIVEIIVAPNGSTRVQTKGFAGGECRAASDFVEMALGKRTEEKLTGEFYVPGVQQQSLREGA